VSEKVIQKARPIKGRYVLSVEKLADSVKSLQHVIADQIVRASSGSENLALQHEVSESNRC
jgi:hypothetical protein